MKNQSDETVQFMTMISRLTNCAVRMLVLALFSLAMTVSAAPDLSLENANSYPGGTVAVPVNFVTGGGAVALQFDVLFDSARLVSQPATGSTTLPNHLVASSEPTTGVRRVLVYSLANSPLTNGILVQLPFTVRTNAALGPVSLSVSNVVIASAGATAVVPTSLTGGSLTIYFPARLGEVVRSTDGRVQFQLTGEINRQYVIEASFDLTSWSALATNVATGGVIDFTDTTAINLNHRFYRAVLRP